MKNQQSYLSALKCIVLGLCLTMFTLHVAYLDVVLPFIGIYLMSIHLWKIHKHNMYFRHAFYSACAIAVLFILTILLNATPYTRAVLVLAFVSIIFQIYFILQFSQAIESLYIDWNIKERYGMKNVRIAYIAFLGIIVLSLPLLSIGLFLIFISFALLVYIAYSFFKSIKQLKNTDVEVNVEKPRYPLALICIFIALLIGGSLYGLNNAFLSYETQSYEKLTPSTKQVQASLIKKGIPKAIVTCLSDQDAQNLNSGNTFQVKTMIINYDDNPAIPFTSVVAKNKDGVVTILGFIDWKEIPTTHTAMLKLNLAGLPEDDTYTFTNITHLYSKEGTLYASQTMDQESFSLKKGKQRKSYFMIYFESNKQDTLTLDVDLQYRNDALVYPYKDFTTYTEANSFPSELTDNYPSYAVSHIYFTSDIVMNEKASANSQKDENTF